MLIRATATICCWHRNKHSAGKASPYHSRPVLVARSCQQRRPPKTMGLLQSSFVVALLFQLVALAHGPLGSVQEKPLVGDASFDYAEACPDYAKYSTSPQ